jgi:hypothetical protein
MARIGHSSPRAALRYQHATRERDEQIADHLDAVIAAAEESHRAAIVQINAGSRGVAAGFDG